MFDIDNMKSYKTEENLTKALEKLGIEIKKHFYLVVCNRNGRFTAVFPVSNIKDGNMTRYARHGFMTIG